MTHHHKQAQTYCWERWLCVALLLIAALAITVLQVDYQKEHRLREAAELERTHAAQIAVESMERATDILRRSEAVQMEAAAIQALPCEPQPMKVERPGHQTPVFPRDSQFTARQP